MPEIETENTTENPAEDVEQTDEVTDENASDTTEDEGQQEPETFDRAYVEKLRGENQRYRERAKKSDELARRLHTELVRATGRLADPSDLAFDEAHIDDPDAIAAAIDELLGRKPHLASRRVVGDIGQGATRSAETVDLAAILRGRA